MVVKKVNILYCYDHKSSNDKSMRDELDKHISTIQDVVTEDYHYTIAGGDQKKAIDEHLATVDILLLLESADFHKSDECINIERIAKDMYDKHKAYVVPILLRPVELEGRYFSSLQPLPHNREYITTWSNRDLAYLDVRSGVRSIVDVINKNRKRERLLESASQHLTDKNYVDALQNYLTALSLFPKDLFVDNATTEKSQAKIWLSIADIYYKCKKWPEALNAYQNAVDYDPHDVQTYRTMAELCIQLSDLPQAIDVYTTAISANSQFAELYILKSVAFWLDGQYDNALAICDAGIEACSDAVAVRKQKGNLLYKSERYVEACEVYRAALNEDHDDTYLYMEYGNALWAAKRFLDAADAYKNAIDVCDRKNINSQTYSDELERKYLDVQNELSQERKKNRALRNRSKPLE